MNNFIIAALLFCTISSVFLIWYLFYLQAKKNCYLLMDTFSDTVLFQYNVRKDLLSFSGNAPKMLKIHSCTQTHCLNHFPLPFIHPDDQKTFQSLLTGTAIRNTSAVQIRLNRPDGSFFWCLVQVQCRIKKYSPIIVIGKITDIEDVIQRENSLVRVAEMDGLTGLYNRSASEMKISASLKEHPFGVFYTVDIDNFKQINDRYGHVAGDKVIQFIATGMRSTFSKKDILGRTGGDEFIIFSPAHVQPADAQAQIRMLMQHLKTASRINLPAVSVSAGISMYPYDGITYQELYHAADDAMYAAKRSGKCCICFYQDIQI